MYFGSNDQSSINKYYTECKDRIVNAMSLGMSLPDAYLLVELSPSEIEVLEADRPFKAQCDAVSKRLELTFLEHINTASRIQAMKGKHSAAAWALEHLYDRYYKGGAQDGPVGTINLKIGSTEGADIEVHGATAPV